MSIGTSVDFVILGDGAGVQSTEKHIDADADSLQSDSLIGAASIVAILSSAAGMVNKDYVFTPGTGIISNYPVYAGEVHTIFYKRL